MSKVKELPHDLLAEKSLLGCLIIDGSSFDEISDLSLVQEDFYHPQYGIIFEVIKDLVLNHEPIDYITLCARLKDRGKLDIIGGQAAILGIVEDQAHSVNVYHYAKIIKEKSSLRKIVKTAMQVADNGINFSGKTQEFIQDVESKFFKLTSDAKSGGMAKLNECLKLNLKELEDSDRRPGEITGLSTGFNKLDEILLGMQAGQMIILAARPAMGKTSFALNVALNSCRNSGLPVAIFSLEMINSELSMRLLSSNAKVDSRRIRSKNFLDTDIRAIGKSVQDLSKLPILINDNGNVTLLDIISECRKIKAEQGLGLIVIDYLQLMRSHTNNPSREQQISEISRGIKAMAKELECPILALSQLNRGVESRPNKRPNVSDLRESGSIEQDADIVMMIYRDEVYDPNTKEKGVAEVIVGKNRGGETGTAKLAWVGSYTSFENLSFQDNES